jgi:hypothetical protein
MRVTFTKAASWQYTISIDRERGPRLLPRGAPGFDESMPHDLAHYLVEESFGIELGVFGQIAAGASGIFFPAAADDSLRSRRTSARIGAVGRADMQRSEDLVRVCMSEWHRSRGVATPLMADTGVRVDPERLAQAVARIDAVAKRWQRLPVGDSLRFTWTARAFDPAGSKAGRRVGREGDARRGARIHRRR